MVSSSGMSEGVPPRVFCKKKDVLYYFASFTGKHLKLAVCINL